MMWYGHETASLGWVGLGVLWLTALGLVIWLVAHLLPASGGKTDNKSALETIDRQLANGEIDVSAWQARRATVLAIQDKRK